LGKHRKEQNTPKSKHEYPKQDFQPITKKPRQRQASYIPMKRGGSPRPSKHSGKRLSEAAKRQLTFSKLVPMIGICKIEYAPPRTNIVIADRIYLGPMANGGTKSKALQGKSNARSVGTQSRTNEYRDQVELLSVYVSDDEQTELDNEGEEL
jgi:hypothetical protein